ncbi:expressed protein [Cryptococcus deneoformans JEC21]|uniref:Expressed protein n=1 Tax=Cryptococcus deneoformans (strain JEC21 / ATCC MYA-565) TaxID=214684 RepID=Q5KPV1_CRYD1|nr:expressed protein [Cryptococcus neoformans var. neoformans JEC21]AAW40792.1 expressed protein [Cryptococcus neoformans var. neoformans JEC21]
MYGAEDSELKAVRASKRPERRKKRPKEIVFPDLDLSKIRREVVNRPHRRRSRGAVIQQLKLRCDGPEKSENQVVGVSEAGYEESGIGAGYEARYGSRSAKS